jgi:hypothetical protein
LVFEENILNVINESAPQEECEEKEKFWRVMDEMIQ